MMEDRHKLLQTREGPKRVRSRQHVFTQDGRIRSDRHFIGIGTLTFQRLRSAEYAPLIG
jgi:hypothetical protein